MTAPEKPESNEQTKRKCPACGSARADGFNRKYLCGSVGPYAGDRIQLEQSDACKLLSAANAEVERLRDTVVSVTSENDRLRGII